MMADSYNPLKLDDRTIIAGAKAALRQAIIRDYGSWEKYCEINCKPKDYTVDAHWDSMHENSKAVLMSTSLACLTAGIRAWLK